MNVKEELTIDGIEYVRKQPEDASAYKIVRTEHAGVWAGELVSRNGTEAVMRAARCLWSWTGANSLSEMANDGPATPKTCRFTAPSSLTLIGVIAVYDVTAKARTAIVAVPEWKQS